MGVCECWTNLGFKAELIMLQLIGMWVPKFEYAASAAYSLGGSVLISIQEQMGQSQA